MIKSQKGQTLILFLVLLPLFLLIFGLLSRSGTTALVHDQIENHCNKKVLDILGTQAKGLALLGLVNDKAKLIIDIRRIVDGMIAAGVFYIYSEPALLSMRRVLQTAQKIVDKYQLSVKKGALLLSEAEIMSQTPQKFRGKIRESYKPTIPQYYLSEEKNYENEVGAPLQPNDDFDKKQRAWGKVTIFTEKFLWWWPKLNKKSLEERIKSPDMSLQCEGKISLKRLEDKWQVELVADKP